MNDSELTIGPASLSMRMIIFLILVLITAPDDSRAAMAHSASALIDQSVKQASQPEQADKSSTHASPAESGATSTSELALPFKRAWQYLTSEATAFPAVLDGERIYLPLEGGRVVCLDRETGALLWSSEPGGAISAPIGNGEKAVYIATRKFSEDGAEAGAALHAVDKVTGLTLWARDYARPFTSPLALAQERIYAGSADGAFYALSSNSGEVIWKTQTQDVVRGRALMTERAIYFGSDDGAMRGIDPASGKEIWKFQTRGPITGRPAIDDRSIYFGSGDGYIYSVNTATGKLRWRMRTGAAVEASPVIVGERVLVASFDNFVYALARASGDPVWKRRFDNRIAAAPIVEGDATMIAPLRADHVAVFLNADGRRVSFYKLDRGFEIVAEPIYFSGTLLLATDKGLVVATASQSADHRVGAMQQ